jgi:hypothetical protein
MQVVGGKSALGIIHPIWLVNHKGERERERGRELVVNLPNFIAKEHNNNWKKWERRKQSRNQFKSCLTFGIY